MYSPKIKEELIPKIYDIARANGIRMTTLVNEILGKALNRMKCKEDGYTNEGGRGSIRGPDESQD